LLDEYGRNQLRAVIERATQRLLREAVDIVQSHEPDSKPSSRSRNDVMIDFIVEKVAGPGY
jgi:aryl-alcohol dehydrogenase-like predicted oxidoreductase